MLVLARKKNETIVINDEVVIQVLQIKGKTIRLGISAPNDVRIARGELKPLEIEVAACDGLAIVGDNESDESETQNASTRGTRSVRATKGLSRFIKSNNQVGEERTTYSGPLPNSKRLDSLNPNRLVAITSEDQYSHEDYSREVRESATAYQATCEIELPIARFRSNQN